MPEDLSNSTLLNKLTLRELIGLLVYAFVVGGIWVSLNSRISAEEVATESEKVVDEKILVTQQQFKLDISEIKQAQDHLADDVSDFKKQVEKDNQEIKKMLNKLLDRELQR